jgi:hypothetical protein
MKRQQRRIFRALSYGRGEAENSFLDPRKLDPIEQRSYLELNQFPARDLNVRCGSRAESLAPSKSGLHYFR